MTSTIYPPYPPPLTSTQAEYLISNINDWAIAHGLAVRPAPHIIPTEIDSHRTLAVAPPVTLFPSPFPRRCFEEAATIQATFNELYARVAQDEAWLGEVIGEITEVDGFIAKLWDIHSAVKKEGYAQHLTLGLFRSDYLVHIGPGLSNARPEIKQVEFNTIASSFGGLSSRVADLHRHLLSIDAYPPCDSINAASLPINRSVEGLAAALASAHKHYGVSKSAPILPTCVIILVQPQERNVFDQRHIEYRLCSHHQITVFRLPFDQILAHTSIRPGLPKDRPLVFTPPQTPSHQYEVAVLYFRAGYSPDEYSQPRDWEARLQLERSSAIKCPSILTHLAGSKKVQQVLATPNSSHLSRFLHDPAQAERVRRTFAAIYPLDSSPAGLDARKIALDPVRARGYVLKPQREGGGNNIYRSAITPFLKALPEAHWKGYILMELIEPPELCNVILRNGEIEATPVIGELGMYGTCLWQHGTPSQQIMLNENAGYLLRTKARNSEEGGVAGGFGSIDSCCLVDV